MYVLFRRCSRGPARRERAELKRRVSELHGEQRVMSSLMVHCGSPRIRNEEAEKTAPPIVRSLACMNLT